MLSELKTSKQKEQNSEVGDFHGATKQEVQKRWNARLRTKRSTENTFANKQIVKIWYVVTLTIAHWQSAWRNDWNSKRIKNRERWIYSSHVNEYGKPLDFWRKLHICNTYSIYFLFWATMRKASDIWRVLMCQRNFWQSWPCLVLLLLQRIVEDKTWLEDIVSFASGPRWAPLWADALFAKLAARWFRGHTTYHHVALTKTNTQTKRCHISHIFSSHPIVNPNSNPINSKVLSRMHF